MSKLEVRILDSLADVSSEQWDQLAGADPFLQHGFLHGLEATNCLTPQGWYPQHLAVFDEDKLCGAMPLYVRDNSYGEFGLRLELGRRVPARRWQLLSQVGDRCAVLTRRGAPLAG